MRDYVSAVKELAFVPREEAVQLLDRLASEPDLEFQARAIDGMVKISREDAEALATRFLNDPASHLHLHAVRALWNIASRRSVPLIINALKYDREQLARSWAAFALGDLGDASALPALEAAAENDNGTDHEGRPIRDTARKSIEKIRSRLAKARMVKNSDEGERGLK
jgi:HEAT repeat protein